MEHEALRKLLLSDYSEDQRARGAFPIEQIPNVLQQEVTVRKAGFHGLAKRGRLFLFHQIPSPKDV